MLCDYILYRMSDKERVTYIGKVDFRNKELPFGIKQKDRTRHTYVIGKTGMGKSTLLENLVIQDIQNGEGVCVIDPHGSMVEKLLDFIPENRIKDVIYFAPFDSEHPIGLNVLEKVSADKRHLVANGVMAAFKKLFKDQFSARMEYILNNIILALLENDGQSLLGVNRMLTDKEYRKMIVSNVTDPTVKDFWVNEYANYTDRFAQEAAPAIQNKVGQFVANPLIRNIIGQKRTSFDIREVMDKKKILLVNLSKGKVGEGNANLIGSLLITKIYLAAMSRADAGPYELDKLPPFYFYVDEFQNFANESFASILSEARKYNLALTVAHQYVEQMEDEVKAAVFGNVGTMIVFRVGATDAEIFEKEFAPYFTMDDIVNLSAYQIYLRLMIDGAGSNPFSARTLDPIQKPPQSFAQMILLASKTTYGKPRFVVEEEIAQFYTPVIKEKKEKDPTENTPKNNNHQHQNYSQKRQEEERVKPEEKIIKVRKIKDDTPLPPKIPQKRDHEDVTSNYEKGRTIEESFHRPPKESNQNHAGKHQQQKKENHLKVMDTPLFDEKPAMSLKDALAKAMNEQTVSVKEGGESNNHRSNTEIEQREEPPVQAKKKEIDEHILRDLLDDE